MEQAVHRAPARGGELSADRAESWRRMLLGWLLVIASLMGKMGASWDIQWHAAVGPDTFWTPPHGMLYGSRIIGGFAALYAVISTTIRYRRGVAGVSDETTTPWLKVLRAPMGFVVAGLGVVCFILGGLYDLWWHTIYGFDVTLLSPSHFGLMFADLVSSLGILYVFASESNRARARGERGILGFTWADLGVAIGAAELMTAIGIFTEPGLREVRFAGPLLTYPVAISMTLALGLLISAGFMRKPGAATLTAALFTLNRLIALVWAPPAVEWLRAQMDLTYRVGGAKFPVVGFTLPAFVIVAGLLVDMVLYLWQRARLSKFVGVAVAAAAAVGVNFLLDPRWIVWVDLSAKGAAARAELLGRMHSVALPSAVVSMAAAAAMAWFAWGVGYMLRHTDK